MAEKVVDDEFEFNERAVEGGLLDRFLPVYLLHSLPPLTMPFGLLSGKWQLALRSELAFKFCH